MWHGVEAIKQAIIDLRKNGDRWLENLGRPIGSVCGLALAAFGFTFIRRFLYGSSPADLRVALASLVVIIAVALVAAAIPAWRAASLDPTQALRSE